uniref:Translation machinery associated TMA7 n=1 Tax=Setaria italica TaxID=4555 RepID=K3Y1L0_SETIT
MAVKSHDKQAKLNPISTSKSDLAYLQKKKDEEKALKELKAKAQKGAIGGSGLKKSGKK